MTVEPARSREDDVAMTETAPRPPAPSLDELGPNAGLVEEMYRLYRDNPQAVSAGWREFFADYVPRATVAPAPATSAPSVPSVPTATATPSPSPAASPAP